LALVVDQAVRRQHVERSEAGRHREVVLPERRSVQDAALSLLMRANKVIEWVGRLLELARLAGPSQRGRDPAIVTTILQS
jgi:hypothetical protein